MVLSGEPTCNNIRVDVVDGPEVVIGGEAGVELDGETMSGWKEEDVGDMGNVMLLKDVSNHDAFRCVMEGVFGVWESGDCVDENGIIAVDVGGVDLTGGGKVILGD